MRGARLAPAIRPQSRSWLRHGLGFVLCIEIPLTRIRISEEGVNLFWQVDPLFAQGPKIQRRRCPPRRGDRRSLTWIARGFPCWAVCRGRPGDSEIALRPPCRSRRPLLDETDSGCTDWLQREDSNASGGRCEKGTHPASDRPGSRGHGSSPDRIHSCRRFLNHRVGRLCAG